MNKSIVILGNLAFAALVYFVLFQDIGYQPILVWDEARNALSALEMLNNHNFLIRHYQGYPDMWEVKPPLMVWLQVISMKVFGYNEVGVRIPSAMATLGMIIWMIYFFRKEFNKPYLGYFAGMVLLTSMGFMSDHIARTGDHDALLTGLLFFASTKYFLYLKYKRSKHLYHTAIAIILAVYTKSVVGLFILPALLVYTLIKKELLWVIRQKHFYFSILLFVFVVGAYYALREIYNPGYLKAVWDLELFNRYSNSSEKYRFSTNSPLYYVERLFDFRFTWVYFILVTPIIPLLKKTSHWFKDILVFFFVIVLSILLIISFGTTKEWYDAPLYPFMATIVAIGINWFWERIESDLITEKSKIITFSMFFILIFAFPYRQSAINSYKPKPAYDQVTYGMVFQSLEKKNSQFKHFTIVNDNYNAHLEFYQIVFNRYKGYDIDNIKSNQEILSGDTLMFGQWHIHDLVHQKFEVELIEKYENAVLVVVH